MPPTVTSIYGATSPPPVLDAEFFDAEFFDLEEAYVRVPRRLHLSAAEPPPACRCAARSGPRAAGWTDDMNDPVLSEATR